MFAQLLDDNDVYYDVIISKSIIKKIKFTSSRNTTNQSLDFGYCNNVYYDSTYHHRYKASDFVATEHFTGACVDIELNLSLIPDNATYIMFRVTNEWEQAIKIECNY